jgi:DNA primase
MYNNIVNASQYLLEYFPNACVAREYLNSRLNTQTQKKFKFGYFPNVSNINAITDLIDEQVLLDSNLLFSKMIEDSLCPRKVYDCYFENHQLILPFHNTYGHIIGLIGRSLNSDSEIKIKKISKYKNTQFAKSNFLFGLYENKNSIIESNTVYIVEGQFDVIKAWECGLRNVVALSTSSMTAAQFALITRYTNNLVLLLDNDESGEKGRFLIQKKFGEFANIQNWYVPYEYKDIDAYLTKKSICKYEDMSFIVKY